MPSDDVHTRLSGTCGLKKFPRFGQDAAPVRNWRKTVYIPSPVPPRKSLGSLVRIHDTIQIQIYKQDNYSRKSSFR